MKIATLQFDPYLGELEGNIARAEVLLKTVDLRQVDLLVAPEMALTGYNFPSLHAISELLEPTCAGPTAWWAAKTAREYGIVVSIGYPEITTEPDVIPGSVVYGSDVDMMEVIANAKTTVLDIRRQAKQSSDYWTFNSTVTIGPDGRVLAHYRKTHLYFTDATWASPSIEGFTTRALDFGLATGSINTTFAICMDLNPRAFTAKWSDFEVANHMVKNDSRLLIVSTAWMTRDEAAKDSSVSPCCPVRRAQTPEMETLTYWLERLVPLIKAERKTTVVIANRIGNEVGAVKTSDLEALVRPRFEPEVVEDLLPTHTNILKPEPVSIGNVDSEDTSEESKATLVSESAHYAGTSVVLTLGYGEVSILKLLGRGVDGVLVVNTVKDESMMTFKIKQAEEDDEEHGSEE